MKILVTGGAGFIGSHLVDKLIDLGNQVLVIDNLSTGNINNVNPKAIFKNADLINDDIESIFAYFQPEIVFHKAAQVSVPKSMINPVLDAQINIIGTIKVLECCAKFSVSKIIYPSSAAIYGTPHYLPVDEFHEKNGESFYGLSKFFPEKYISLFSQSNNLKYTILRYSNVFGSRQDHNGEGGVVSIFYERFIKGESVSIYGDGEQTRDFIYVKDVVEANINSIDKGDNQIFNISSNTQISINNLHQLFCDEFHVEKKPLYESEREGEIRHSVLENSNAIKVLGWKPNFSTKSGILDMLRNNVL